jgi:uncharacterized protein (DUF1786 family)
LAIDVGSGTQDILVYEEGRSLENDVKAVLPSQTTILAHRIAQATSARRPLFLWGRLMGGGPCVGAIWGHLRAGLPVYATPIAAKTIRDDPDEVRAMGVQIVERPPVGDVVALELKDVDLDRLSQALGLFEVTLPTSYAVAVQDHGECPGESQRRFRFLHWERFIREGGHLSRLAYGPGEVPPYLTRLLAVQELLPGALVMDTGAAAIRGAMLDPAVDARRVEGLVVLNAGNQHVVGALVRGARVYGMFEHHTHLIDLGKLIQLVSALREGTLSNDAIYADEGHGAFISPDYPGGFHFLVVTGPQRALARPMQPYFAVPFGDMMLAGAFGLLAADLERRGLPFPDSLQ